MPTPSFTKCLPLWVTSGLCLKMCFHLRTYDNQEGLWRHGGRGGVAQNARRREEPFFPALRALHRPSGLFPVAAAAFSKSEDERSVTEVSGGK